MERVRLCGIIINVIQASVYSCPTFDWQQITLNMIHFFEGEDEEVVGGEDEDEDAMPGADVDEEEDEAAE